MQIISGSTLSKEIKARLLVEATQLNAQFGRVPKLALVLVGDNPDSFKYVNSKNKTCNDVGIAGEIYHLHEETSQQELLSLILKLNSDTGVDGILVQLPLPSQLNTEEILNAVDYRKDADGLHPMNAGKLADGHADILPCTPKGIISLLKYGNIEIAGKHAVVLGRSNLVGKPTAQLLLQENATVTICHSKSKNIIEVVKTADILVLAMGCPDVVTPDMLKKGVVIVDVAMNWVDNKLGGDIYFESNLSALEEKVAAITPVPGGVGPMTITSLIENTFLIFKNKMAR
ncbi:MAG: bifunctional 5,10-methylenetetrahydrofolate dehydrogenase/5,10-methenyltetrahydrofolate cyclohydrolase [Bacteroidales bacterium]|jgi:methylenetetrahydrofolate dehydrogenase (NADP+)/methenyltetrahydrofolate cyclohydrolase|nr:bifunctional 5,10-methylenetetrahydrofolate dehydrogenase/5,10-methenyltetrahydrofolate cyclohydrolase [Bacteroidales bacterium]